MRWNGCVSWIEVPPASPDALVFCWSPVRRPRGSWRRHVCTGSISVPTQCLPVRIPGLTVKHQPGDPFTSCRKAFDAKHDHHFLGTKRKEGERGVRSQPGAGVLSYMLATRTRWCTRTLRPFCCHSPWAWHRSVHGKFKKWCFFKKNSKPVTSQINQSIQNKSYI